MYRYENPEMLIYESVFWFCQMQIFYHYGNHGSGKPLRKPHCSSRHGKGICMNNRSQIHGYYIYKATDKKRRKLRWMENATMK